MVMKGKDNFSGVLFENPSDKEGNVYDEKLNLIKEAPSEGLLEARKMHPECDDRQLSSLAVILQRQIEKEKKKKKI